MKAATIENYLKTFHYWLGLFLVFWMALGHSLIPYISGLWVLSGLLLVRKSSFASQYVRWRYILLFLALYLAHFVSVVYSDNQHAAWFSLEVKMALLLFPVLVVLMMQHHFEKKLSWIFIAFLAGNIVAMIYNIVMAAVSHASFSWNHFVYQKLSFFLHPSYYSLYLDFALAVLLFYFLPRSQHAGRNTRIIVISISVVIFGFIIMLSSRAGILAAFCVLMIKTIQLVVHSNLSRLLKVFLFLFAFIFLSVVTVSNKRMQSAMSNFTDNFRLDQEQLKGEKRISSAQTRLLLWKSSLNVIHDHWLIGTGSGDANDEITRELIHIVDNPSIFTKNYNAHNQFLDTFVALGVIGFVLLMALLFWPLIVAIKTENYLLMALAVLLIVHLMFESMVNRQAGVIFFSFFLPLLFGFRQSQPNN
ncbi:MAG: O-antigen ligase family protein [Bacteroidota bacterium]